MVLLSIFIRLHKENIIKHHNPHPLIVDKKRDILNGLKIFIVRHAIKVRIDYLSFKFFLLLKSLTLHARIIKM